MQDSTNLGAHDAAVSAVSASQAPAGGASAVSQIHAGEAAPASTSVSTPTVPVEVVAPVVAPAVVAPPVIAPQVTAPSVGATASKKRAARKGSAAVGAAAMDAANADNGAARPASVDAATAGAAAEEVIPEVVTPEVVTLAPKHSAASQSSVEPVTVEPITEISADEADAARIRYGLEHSFAQHFGASEALARRVVPQGAEVEVLPSTELTPVVPADYDESPDAVEYEDEALGEFDDADSDAAAHLPVPHQGSRALVRVNRGSSLGAFMQAAKREPLLSPEEEHQLALRLRDLGDLEAARKLVTSHLRLVISVARSYAGYGLPLPDLIQEGNIGLMKAVRHFNPDVGVRLAAFAVHWIKAEILDYVLRNWRMVKVATTKAQRKLFFTLRELKLRLGWFTNDERQEVAHVLGVSPHEVAEMETRLAGSDMSFDAESNDDSGATAALPAPASYLEDESSNFAQVLENNDYTNWQVTKLKEALASLDERSRHIIKRRWLDDNDKATLQELAHELGVSIERVRQIENNALGKIKNILLQAGVAPEGAPAKLALNPTKKKTRKSAKSAKSTSGRTLSVVQRTKTKSAATKSGATKGLKAKTSAGHKADLHSAHMVVAPQDDASDVPNVSLKQVATTVTKAQTIKVNQATKLSKVIKPAEPE